MKKLGLLRDVVIKRLKLDGADVTAFCENAQVINYYKKPSDSQTNSNFKLQYDAKLFVANFSGDINVIVFIVNKFMSVYCPNHGHNDLSFESEILDHQNSDLLLTIKNVEETVKVKVTDEGVALNSCDDSCCEVDPILNIAGLKQLKSGLFKGG